MRFVPLFLLVATLGCGAFASFPGGDGVATSEDGVDVRYDDRGSGSPTLVFVHGWSCDRTYWAEQRDVFAARHRVVTLDLGGHGESGADRTEWTIPRLADDVVAVLDDANVEDAVLVGHSMGAPVALVAAAARRDRVRAIVAVDALHDAERKMPEDVRRRLMEAYRDDFAGTMAKFARSVFPPGADAGLVERVAADMASAPPEVAVPLLGTFAEFDVKAALRDAQVPIRCINAAGSSAAVDVNRRYAEDFDVVTLPDVGHFLMLEKPREFNLMLEHVVGRLGAR